MDKPGTAAILSLVVPGVGQIYNGAFLRGLFWLVITPGFWLGTGGTLGWVCHLISAYTAYQYARRLGLSAPPRPPRRARSTSSPRVTSSLPARRRVPSRPPAAPAKAT